MTDAELLHELFRGSDLSHGRSELTLEVTAKGKHEAKSWTEKRPVTVQDWEGHLAGKAGIGIPPLNSENKVRWGAIDVDEYSGALEKLNALVQQHRLPLVVCRSKSGGPHLFMFLNDWVPASAMIERLDSLAGFLGFGTSEIFPKQAMIGKNDKAPDYGSWINMPYFDAKATMRYALDKDGKAITEIAAFVDYAKSRTLTVETFMGYTPPPPTNGEIFPDGPPCLNTIFANNPVDFRNVILSNVAVYCKKAFPEEWQTKVDEYNQKFPEPLGSSEVEAIKRSYDKKDYRYQCSKQPLCNFCDSSKCKKTKHGIGRGDFLPASRSLTMVDTNPPIWYLDITMPDGKDKRISLTTEQLQNPRLFQRRAMETIQQMPPSMKMDAWEPIVQQLMVHCHYVHVPPELGPSGMFKELVSDFLSNRASQESMEDVLRGVPFKNNKAYFFRLKDLWSYVQQQRFTLLKPHEMMQVLLREMAASKDFHKVKNRGVNLVTIPLAPEGEAQPLTVPKFDQHI